MSAKRYDCGKANAGDWDLLEFTDGEYVKASDYDALVSVCREFYKKCNCNPFVPCVTCAKALAILDGEKNEGVKRSKSI